MGPELDLDWIVHVTKAKRATRGRRIQSLWGGYGELLRVELAGAEAPSVIVKWVKPPARGRREDERGDARKRRSYEVEIAWYRSFAARCDDTCRVARRIGDRVSGDEIVLVLEDLDAAGFGERRRLPNPREIDACLAWLAAFHARFLGVAPDGLWRTGTYWHLETRPDELAAIEDDELRAAAPLLDRELSQCRFETLVHGDAKLANFCFGTSANDERVAAVDFQYVGGGCGMKDVAYLVTGRPDALERRHLDHYFARLRDACRRERPEVDVDALEEEWRALYPVACVDFFRFLAGWSKDHWARDDRARRMTREVLAMLGEPRST